LVGSMSYHANLGIDGHGRHSPGAAAAFVAVQLGVADVASDHLSLWPVCFMMLRSEAPPTRGGGRQAGAERVAGVARGNRGRRRQPCVDDERHGFVAERRAVAVPRIGAPARRSPVHDINMRSPSVDIYRCIKFDSLRSTRVLHDVTREVTFSEITVPRSCDQFTGEETKQALSTIPLQQILQKDLILF